VDPEDKAFDSALESSKLATTLSAGIIAFTVTFSKQLGGRLEPGAWETILLFLSWAALLGSMGAGILTLLKMVDVLHPPGDKQAGYQPSIRDNRIKNPFRVQLSSLLAGVVILTIYGVVTLFWQ
jgi:hypothetical protein